MGLHSLDGKLISEKSRRAHEYVEVFHKRAPEVTAKKVRRIINECLDDVISNAGKFVYTRSGIALGHGSKVPHADLLYVWDKITSFIIGKPRPTNPLEEVAMLKGIGAMFQWVVAGRPEFWMVKFTDTGKISILDQKEVKIAEYWIADAKNFKRVMGHHTAQDLVNKFNSARF